MNVLFLVQSFIPQEKQDEYLPILQKTINSIRCQDRDDKTNIKVVLTDDGSAFIKHYSSQEIGYLTNSQLEKVKETYQLNVDEIVAVAESEFYQKAELWNFYLFHQGSNYDLIIFLDDDHNFVKNDSLRKFIQHYQEGYNFIVGRLYHPVDGFRIFDYDTRVQGTTFAFTWNALKNIGFFSASVKNWGCGEDSDIFWRAYLGHKDHKIKAICDGNIITVDNISGRWKYCLSKLGGVDIFKRKFLEEYGVNPHQNPSRHKTEWMDIIPDELGFSETTIQFMTLENYLNYPGSPKIKQILLRLSLIKRKLKRKLETLLK